MAITNRQLKLEQRAYERALVRGCKLIVCDRAPYDNLAYPMGEEVIRQSHVRPMNSYHTVIHLQSLAVIDARRYATVCSSNAGRVEDAQAAIAQDAKTLQAWRAHPNYTVIAASNLADTQRRVRDIVVNLLSG